jgi:type IV pilus biogenesis protein CpaD/CtpE
MAVNNHKSRSSAAIAVALAIALTGCGSTDSIADTAPAKDTSDTPVITQLREVEDYPTAEVAGVLDLEAGCLTLDRHVVFWPYGAATDVVYAYPTQ